MLECNCSGYFKANIVILILIFVLQSVGLGTDHWVKVEFRENYVFQGHSGLWRLCQCYYGANLNDEGCFCQSFAVPVQGQYF
jgi:hypothetical protein